LTVHALRAWLDIRIWYDEELKVPRLMRPEKETVLSDPVTDQFKTGQ
jgi:hypothetical protein